MQQMFAASSTKCYRVPFLVVKEKKQKSPELFHLTVRTTETHKQLSAMHWDPATEFTTSCRGRNERVRGEHTRYGSQSGSYFSVL